MDPIDSLFRRESGRLIAALVRVFGLHNLALAEDVAQDALCRALEVWKFRGWPDNPSAWLMATAKRRAIDMLRREKTARTFAPELGRLLESEWTLVPSVDALLHPNALEDDLLRMMFSCCHPRTSDEVRTALILNLLCGFGIGEVSGAFLISHAAAEKRVQRGKRILSRSKLIFDVLDSGEVARRLPSVQRALYLLFNEGYHGASPLDPVRTELCQEAMHLASLLLKHRETALPSSYALLAMMCLHGARLPARLDAAGTLSALHDQDRTRWDPGLIAEGQRLLHLSAEGTELTEFHLEAALANVHAQAHSFEQTNWKEIVALYDKMVELHPSPIVALNRGIALGQSEGPARGLEALKALSSADQERLSLYPFFPAALGELEARRGQISTACVHFRRARALARNKSERRFFQLRLDALDAGSPKS